MQPSTTNQLNVHDVVKVIGTKSTRWYTLGVFFKLTQEDLDVIEEDQSNTEMKCEKMVQKWLQFKPNATWGDLREALSQIRESSLAAEMLPLQPRPQQDNGGQSVSTAQTEEPPAALEHNNSSKEKGLRGVRGGVTSTKLTTVIPKPLKELPKEKSQDISSEFALMFATIVGLISEVLNCEKLKICLEAFCNPETLQPYIDSKLYINCKTTEEILRSLRQYYIHPYDLGILRRIIKWSQSDKSRELLHKYMSVVCSISLRHLRTPFDITASDNDVTLVVHIEGSLDSHSVQKIDDVKDLLQAISGVSRDMIMLQDISEGCVVLTFIIPGNARTRFIFATQDHDNMSKLARNGILKVIVSDDCDLRVPLAEPVQHLQTTVDQQGSPDSGHGSDTPQRRAGDCKGVHGDTKAIVLVQTLKQRRGSISVE